MTTNLKPTIISKQFLLCPYCGENEHSIDHLFRRDISAGPWYCDKCGKSWIMKFHKNGEIEITHWKSTKQNTLVLLKHGNILLYVKGIIFGNDYASDEYFYNVHTCPTNYLRNAEIIVDKETNDSDPHGIFEYVKSIPYPENYDLCNASVEDLEELFKD